MCQCKGQQSAHLLTLAPLIGPWHQDIIWKPVEIVWQSPNVGPKVLRRRFLIYEHYYPVILKSAWQEQPKGTWCCCLGSWLRQKLRHIMNILLAGYAWQQKLMGLGFCSKRKFPLFRELHVKSSRSPRRLQELLQCERCIARQKKKKTEAQKRPFFPVCLVCVALLPFDWYEPTSPTTCLVKLLQAETFIKGFIRKKKKRNVAFSKTFLFLQLFFAGY